VNKTTRVVLTVILLLILLMQTRVFANTLSISIITDRESYKKNDEVSVSVKWSQKMQAAGFTLYYDSNVLEFVSASIASPFYNSDTKGKISVNWASFDEVDSTSISFKFKAINDGKCTLKVTNPNAFANGNLETPTDYDIKTNGSKEIIIGNGKNNTGTENLPTTEVPKSSGSVEIKQETQKAKSSTDNTKKVESIPYTGLEHDIIYFIGITVVLVIIFYKKYKNLKQI